MQYFRNILIALDQLANTLLAGCPDETLSSRAWRMARRGLAWPRKLIDSIFFLEPGHCRQSYQSEVEGLQLPKEIRQARAGQGGRPA